MMKFYMIPTPGILKFGRICQQYPYQLWLAQWFQDLEMFKTPLSDFALAAKQVTALRTHRIILDNGAFEGVLVPTEKLVRIIMQLKPQIAVLPDIPNEYWMASWKCSMDAAAQLEKEGYKGEFMVCPQGRNPKEVCEFVQTCAESLDPKRYILGLGLCYKHWGTSEKARTQMLNIVWDMLPSSWRVHMLGARLPYGEQAWQWPFMQRGPDLVGMDSFKPTQEVYKECWAKENARNDYHPVQDEDVLSSVYHYAQQYDINIFAK